MSQKIVLITGASAGIGKATAELLMHKGVKVYAASRSGKAPLITSDDGAGVIIPVQLDVNNEENLSAVVEKITAENSRLDAVICNAGNGIAGALEDYNSEDVKFQMETNFFGTVKTIQACLPLFRAQGFGKIITVSSVAGIIPIPYQSVYSAGKAASLILMKALAMEVKPFNIQCCSVLPGDTKTNFTSSRIYAEKAKSEKSAYHTKMTASISKMEKDEQNGMPPEFIARAMVKQVMNKRMKTVIVPGFQYQLICWFGRVLPSKWMMNIVNMLYN